MKKVKSNTNADTVQGESRKAERDEERQSTRSDIR